jgi:excisionase family DNA binding protein
MKSPETYELAKALAPLVAEMVLARLGSPIVDQDDLVDTYQAAKLLGCSVSSVERLVRQGLLPSRKIGHLRRFRRSDLLAFNMEVQ